MVEKIQYPPAGDGAPRDTRDIQSVLREALRLKSGFPESRRICRDAIIQAFRSDDPDLARVISPVPQPFPELYQAYVVFPSGEGSRRSFLSASGNILSNSVDSSILLAQADRVIPPSDLLIQNLGVSRVRRLDHEKSVSSQSIRDEVLLAYLTATNAYQEEGLWRITPDKKHLSMDYLHEKSIISRLLGEKHQEFFVKARNPYLAPIDLGRLRQSSAMPVDERSPEDSVAAQIYTILTTEAVSKQPTKKAAPRTSQQQDRQSIHVVPSLASAEIFPAPTEKKDTQQEAPSQSPLIQGVLDADRMLRQSRLAPTGTVTLAELVRQKNGSLFRFLQMAKRNPNEGSFSLTEGQYGPCLVLEDPEGGSFTIEIDVPELRKLAKHSKKGKINPAAAILDMLGL